MAPKLLAGLAEFEWIDTNQGRMLRVGPTGTQDRLRWTEAEAEWIAHWIIKCCRGEIKDGTYGKP